MKIKNSKNLTKNNIKIALVSLQKIAERGPPIGLIYLATYLRERTGIKNIKIIDNHFDDVEKELDEFCPDIIGITSMTVNYSDVIEFAKKEKEKRDVPLILGGVHISTLPESLDPSFDVGIIGEGEITFSELIELYIRKKNFSVEDIKKIKSVVFKDKGRVVETMKRPALELDTLPFPDFNLVSKRYFDKHEYPYVKEFVRSGFVITSRGCPYKCKFCSTAKFWGNVRLHSQEYVVKLIEHFIKKYNSEYIQIMDDLFTINPERIEGIASELEKKRLLDKIKGMSCQPRANLINDRMCKVLKKLKVKEVNFGFESGSQRMLNWLKDGSVTVEMNKNAIKLCKKYGFYVGGGIIFGSPGEKIEDMEKTLDFIDFAIKNKADYIWLFIAMPYPNTIFWDIALERGKIKQNLEWKDLDTTPNENNINNPPLLDGDVNKKEFKQIFLKANKKLRKMRIKQMFNNIKDHPYEVTKLSFRNPKHYMKRFLQRFYK